MSVNESGLGQCACETNHASHSFHPAGSGVHRCQRAASKVVDNAKIGRQTYPVAYMCIECATYHEERRP